MIVVSRFARNERGAAALEFALVSLPFLSIIIFIMFIALTEFFNVQLDYAVQKSARQVMIGSVQTKAITKSQFRTNYVCATLPVVMSCNDVIVNLQTVTESTQPKGYYQFVNANTTAINVPQLSNASTTFSPGAQNDYEYLQVIYPVTYLPRFMNNIISGGAVYNGSPAFLLISTIAFRNESY